MLRIVQGRLKMLSSYYKPLLNSKMTKEVTEILKTKEELYHLKARCDDKERSYVQRKSYPETRLVAKDNVSKRFILW